MQVYRDRKTQTLSENLLLCGGRKGCERETELITAKCQLAILRSKSQLKCKSTVFSGPHIIALLLWEV